MTEDLHRADCEMMHFLQKKGRSNVRNSAGAGASDEDNVREKGVENTGA